MKNTYAAMIIVMIALLIVMPFIVSGYRDEQQAIAALKAKQYKQASELFHNSAQKLFWRTDLYEQAGIASYLDNEYALSIQDFNRAHITTPQGWDFFGLAYYQNAQPQNAVETWKQGTKYFSDYPLFYRRLSLYSHAQKQYANEKDMLTRYLELKKDDAAAHYDLGILLMLEDSNAAREHLQLASSLDPDFDPASQALITALAISGIQADEAARFVVIGHALGIVNEWDLARIGFERAVSANEKNAEAWAWLGEAKQQTGGDGRAELDRAVQLDHESAIVRSLRGLYWKRQEKYPQALAEYLLATEYEPENPAWPAAVGETYQQLGDLANAFDYYQRATKLAPNESTYWRLLATFCAANNIFVEDVGLPAAQKSVELASKDALALHALGWTYYVSGRLTLAQETLSKVLKIQPDLYIARVHLGLTYFAQNNTALAYNEWIIVRNTDKEGEAGKLAQQLLNQYFPK